MAIQNRTKHLLARRSREMMNEMAFGQIKVSDLCERAGTSRQVLYYHFRDKYDLAAWLLNHEWPLEPDADDSLESPAAKQYAYYWEHRDFHRTLFLDPGQYNMMRYQIEYTMNVTRVALCASKQVETLPLEDELWIRHHAYGMANLLRDWILGNVKMTPEQFARFQCSRYSDDLRASLESFWGITAN